MTVNRGPGVAPIAGVGTTTVQHRLQLAGLYAENAPGVPRSGVLAQATDLLVVGRVDMSYDVGPAPLVIGRTAGEGVYTPTLTGTTNVPTSAAPGTNSRWDLIYVKQNDQAKGDADNDAVIGVQQGTAAASPTKPTADLPAGAYVLAEARIFATTTGTSGGSNTIAQVWRHTAARGAPITIRNATERAEITTPAKGMEIQRLDLTQVSASGVRERWNGANWDHFGHAEFTSATNLAPQNTAWGLGVLSTDTAKTTDTAFITINGGADKVQVRDAGLYEITASVAFTAAISGVCWISPGPSDYVAPMGGGLVTAGVSIANVRLAAGALIQPSLAHGSGASPGGDRTFTGRLRVTRIA